MYPFRTDDVFVRNAWYVACSVDELTGGPMERTILGKPVVLYRGESDRVAAMHALCPHRNYPLALRGTVRGEALQCAYHGFAFDGETGACVLVPSQQKPPGAYRQRVYPVVEQGPWIWIWPGDPTLADASAIPGDDELGLGEGWKYLEPIKFTGIRGRYMLMVENLFDLTHVAFLHGNMGDFAAILHAPLRIEEGGGRLRIVRPMETEWTGHHEIMFGAEHRFEGRSAAASVTTFYGPGYVTTTDYITSAIEGRDAVDKSIYGDVHYHHAITPETRHSCHYFGMSSRMHRHNDPAFDAMFTPFDIMVREQDVVAAEAIEDRMHRFGEPSVELMVRSDRAAGLVRRTMQRLIDQESACRAVREPTERAAAGA